MDDPSLSPQPNCKRRLLLLATTASIAAPGLTACASPAQVSAPRVLRYSDHEPLGGMRTRFLKEVVFPAIELESKGRLKIDDHWNGVIAAAYDALDAVSKGRVDMATVVPEYKAQELPLHQLFKSFPIGPSGAAQVPFFRDVYATVPAFTQELEESNIRPIFLGTGYPVALLQH